MRIRKQKSSSQKADALERQPAIIPVRNLLGATQSVELEHRGEIYRLRITRNGKLILTK